MSRPQELQARSQEHQSRPQEHRPSPGAPEPFPGAPDPSVRDIHEAYRTDGDMICGTHMLYMGSPEREEATFSLLPRATSCI